MGEDQILDVLLARMVEVRLRHERVKGIEEAWTRLTDLGHPRVLDLMADWIREQVSCIGAAGCLFGASGGVDSSLVALVLQRAVPGRCRALVMPCGSDPQDEADARELLELLEIPYKVIPLEAAVDATLGVMGASRAEATPMVVGNLASRLRGTLLYYEANATGAIVIGTGDMDEAYIGYSCKGTTADLFPITGLHKDEVRSLLYLGLEPLSKDLAVRLATRPASPGYWRGQVAEQEIGMPYGRLAAALDVIAAHCEIRPSGVFPREPDQFLDALGSRQVPAQDVLLVSDMIVRNYHKGFGSPCLFRPI